MLKRMVDRLPLGMAFLALILATVAVFFAWQANRQARLTREDMTTALDEAGSPQDAIMLVAEATVRDARRAEERASAASNAADTILGFIESGSILLGALIALGAVVFGLSISDVRSRLDDTVDEAKGLLKDSEQRVEMLEREMRDQLAAAVKSDEERLKENQAQFGELNRRIIESLASTEGRVNQFEDVIRGAVDSAKREAETSFRVLTLLLLAEQQVRARNYETAITTLEEAVELDPNNQPANYLLGYLYLGRKRFQDATEHLQMALASNPDFAPALAAMGLAQYKMADKMTDAGEDSMQINQLRAQAEYNLTRALEMDANLLDADNESYFASLGGLYRRQGRDQEAMKVYKRAVDITPNRSYPVGNLATLYKRFGLEGDAQQMYQHSAEIAEAILDDHPGDIWARLDLAQAYLVMGDTQKAMAEYKNVLGRINQPGPIESAMRTLRYLKDSPESIEKLDEVLEMMQNKIKNLPRETQS